MNYQQQSRNILMLAMLLSTSLGFAVEATNMAVSIALNGQMGNGYYSSNASISAGGRFVVFQSDTTDLVANDTNAVTDIFLRDTLNNTTQRVSVHSSGTQGNVGSFSPAISLDGHYIVFSSYADNLIANDTNDSADVFVYHRETGITTLVSHHSSGALASHSSFIPAISADGRYITFESSANNLVSDDIGISSDIFLHDRVTGNTTRVSAEGKDYSSNNASLSANGRYITYQSGLTGLVAGDTNGNVDIFYFDRFTGLTTRINLSAQGAQTNADSFEPFISADGRYIAYSSYATNLVDNDNNEVSDVFVYDRQADTTRLVSASSAGVQANAVSVAPSLSAAGRYITYASEANNLVSGDTNGFRDIFMYDLFANTLVRLNLGLGGVEANEDTDGYSSSISAHGGYVAFDSMANNLVSRADDTVSDDIFVRSQLNASVVTYAYINSFESTAWPEGWYSYAWSLDNSTRSRDTFSLKTNATANGETALTVWQFEVTEAGTVSFDMRLDSEQGADFFRFYIDGVLISEYSGLHEWRTYTYPLGVGEHLLRFEYSKDDAISIGADSAWIDNIQFSNRELELKQAEFIEGFYVNILGRASDSIGLAFWLEEIRTKSSTAIVFAFFNSPEFRDLGVSNVDFVRMLYSVVLGRAADPAGLEHWVSLLEGGELRRFIIYGFVQSFEFASLSESIAVLAFSDADYTLLLVNNFVKRFYENVLARAPDEGGQDFWLNNIVSGDFSAADIATAFFSSQEFINQNHADADFVDIVYQTILDRPADEAGKINWLTHLANGLSREDMLQGFIVSAEFQALAESYRIRVM